MIALGTQLRVLILCVLVSVSCATRSHLDFRVVPATPNYLLHYPDLRQPVHIENLIAERTQ
jgi:hypothetical protein